MLPLEDAIDSVDTEIVTHADVYRQLDVNKRGKLGLNSLLPVLRTVGVSKVNRADAEEVLTEFGNAVTETAFPRFISRLREKELDTIFEKIKKKYMIQSDNQNISLSNLRSVLLESLQIHPIYDEEIPSPRSPKLAIFDDTALSSEKLAEEYGVLRLSCPAWFVDVLDGEWLKSLVQADAEKDTIVQKALETHEFSMPTDYEFHRDLDIPLIELTRFLLARSYVEKMELKDKIVAELPYLQNPTTVEDMICDVRHLKLDLEFFQQKIQRLEYQKMKDMQERDNLTQQVRMLEEQLEEKVIKKAHDAVDEGFSTTSASFFKIAEDAKGIDMLELAHNSFYKERKRRMTMEKEALHARGRLAKVLHSTQEAKRSLSAQLENSRKRETLQGKEIYDLRNMTVHLQSVLRDLDRREKKRWPDKGHVKPNRSVK